MLDAFCDLLAGVTAYRRFKQLPTLLRIQHFERFLTWRDGADRHAQLRQSHAD
ncbi:hypothetical protein D3C81_2248980 [compost metagenome]